MKNMILTFVNAIAGIVFGLMLELSIDDLIISKPARIVILGVMLAIMIWNTIRSHYRIQARTTIFKVPTGEEARAIHKYKKGLIVTVSPPEANINWEQELLSTSKLNTLITAVKAHASSLEYIWLLGTKGVNGSSSVFEKLSDYLNRNKDSLGLINLKEVKFLDPIEMSEDNQVTECVRRTVDKVLIDLPDGLKQSDIIADCTGGTKSISLGVIFACLEEERDIQLIGSKYGENGKPDGSSVFPMIIEFSTNRAEYNK